MKVLIIGGDGFIGSHICKEFVQKGHQTIVFGPNLNENLLRDIEKDIQRVEGDILDFSSLFNAIFTAQPDIIIHLAAYGEGKIGLTKSAQSAPQKALNINIMGFHNVLEASRILGITRIVWSSSSTVFGLAKGYKEKRVNESSAVNPLTLYGSTKVMAELLSRFYREQYGLEITGLRLPLIFGPGKWYKGAAASIVELFEKCKSSDEVVLKCGDELVDLMYVKDVADAFYHVATENQKLSEIYHINGFTTSLPMLADIVKSLIPAYRLHIRNEPSTAIYPLMDTSKIEMELGYKPKYSIYDACKNYLIEIGGV